MKLSDVKILHKILACLGLFALVVGGALWYSTSEMSKIDARYSKLITNDAVAMRNNIWFNLRLLAYSNSAFSASVETDPAKLAAIVEEKQKISDETKALVDEATRLQPAFAEQINANFNHFEALKAKLDAPGITPQRLNELGGEVDALRKDITAVTNGLLDTINTNSDDATSQTNWTIQMTLASVGIALLAVTIVAFAVVRSSITAPIGKLAQVMEKLAGGQYDVDVEGLYRKDELGHMARSIEAFKQNFTKAIAEERHIVNSSIGAGLQRLAGQDLTYRLRDALPDAYTKLQANFNSAMETLQATIRNVSHSTESISNGTGEIAVASTDLSRRTESQAANLEETAAAVAEITNTVKKMAAGASNARSVVSSAKEEADRSGEVVQRTVNAMRGIEESSKKITHIISVIDEIAFQTNLLALNAGVEAARAGETGRGFAVVASEVRALAQRSADAAREIKDLLSASAVKVDEGVHLVAETGDSLRQIISRVAEITTIVNDIAASAEQQATGLQEVNIAVTQMDQTTQQNAAMVEETTAATQKLTEQSSELAEMMARFNVHARSLNEGIRAAAA